MENQINAKKKSEDLGILAYQKYKRMMCNEHYEEGAGDECHCCPLRKTNKGCLYISDVTQEHVNIVRDYAKQRGYKE